MRRRDPEVSFFMFQDIMMTTMGIVILASLIMALNLHDADPADAAAPESEATDINAQTAALERENAQLRKELSEIRPLIGKDASKEAQRLREQYALIRQEEAAASVLARDTVHDPVLSERIEVLRKQTAELQDAIQRGRRNPRMTYVVDDDARSRGMKPWIIEVTDKAFRVGRPEPGSPVMKFADVAICIDWIASRQDKQEYFVLCKKPSGFSAGTTLEQEMRRRHIKLGVDLILEQSTILSWDEP